MRTKNSSRSGVSQLSSSKDSQDDSSSMAQHSTGNATQSLSSFTNKRAADVFNAYNNSNPFANASENGRTVESNPAAASCSPEISDGAKRLAKELDQFMRRGPETHLSSSGDAPLMSDDAIADLQLATARKLRELLPKNRELLHVAQERNWIPLLLSWLNLHDRPAVQVESLLALTNIAELCAQQSYYQHTQAQSTAVAAAAQAAAAAVKGATGPAAPFYSFGSSTGSNSTSPTTYPYPSLVAPAPGSVPFPPLSFSQTLSPEAVAAFDASLTSTIQSGKAITGSKDKSSVAKFSMPPAPLFPSSPLSSSLPSTGIAPQTGGINFTSLAPPPSGAHSSVPSNAFLPPPTPVSGQTGALSFPQQLSASSQHLLLRHADAIPTLISLLSSPDKEVYEQAMWILGSIAAGDSPSSSSSGSNTSTASLDGGREKSVSARDVILAAGVMNQLLRCLASHPCNLSLQRIGSWTLSNLVDGIFQQSSHGKNGGKGNDYTSSDEIEMAKLLPELQRLLRMADAEVLSYTCWTLSHLCDGPSSHIAAVVTTTDHKAPKGGLVPRLVELLMSQSWRVTKPALRTIGNIVCAECSDDNNHGASTTTDYTEVILECGAVPRLKELVTHCNREIQKEACWTLSNIAAGTVDQIQAVIDSGAIPPLVKLVRDKKTDQEVRSEACWVVLNATSCGSDSQIEVLVDEGCVSVLGVLLSEPSMVMMALEGLERVLQVEESREILRREQIDNGEMEDQEETRTPTLVSASLIEKARENHNSSAVTKRADRIWKQHFVSCALCHRSYSKHRTSDATFCEECKCYVCSNCNCQIYHLSYQEELWAASEEKTEAKKNAKKSRNKKKKEKLKQKRANLKHDPDQCFPVSKSDKQLKDRGDRLRVSAVASSSELSDKVEKDVSRKVSEKAEVPIDEELAEEKTAGFDGEDDTAQNQQNQQPAIDFVLYLQQTGSIIALAKLMDALEYGEDYDEELDDAEINMIRQQELLKQQATT